MAEDRSVDFERHRLEQIRRWAAATSWEDRLAWLESAMELAHELGIDYLAQKHELRERLSHPPAAKDERLA